MFCENVGYEDSSDPALQPTEDDMYFVFTCPCCNKIFVDAENPYEVLNEDEQLLFFNEDHYNVWRLDNIE